MIEQVTSPQVLIAILGSSLLTTIFTKVFDYFTSTKKTRQILLLGAIEQLTDKIVRQGFRTRMQTLRLTEARDQYKKIGGDGYADSIIAEALALPINHEEE
jgi:hypothetical protein